MSTNLEKFRAAQVHIESRATAIAVDVFGTVPAEVWTVGGAGQNYDPQRWMVEKVGYRMDGAYFAKRPSNEQVAAAQKLSGESLQEDRIILFVKAGNSSTGLKLSDLHEGKAWSISRETIEARAAVLREIYIAKDGQFCCAYCGHATDTAKKMTRDVIARQYPGMRKAFDYCSEQCACHHQMAHEG